MTPRPPRTLSIAAVLFAGSLAAADKAEEVRLHKDGVRVVFVYEKTKEVGYLPGRVVPVDAKGEPVAALTLKLAGKESYLLSGRLTLNAGEKDVEGLKGKAEAALGHGVKLTSVKPTSFQVWLFVGGKVVWERPAGDGATRGIPVFGAAPAGGARPEKARLLVSMNWTETIPPSKATLVVDWQKVLKEVEAELSAKTPLTEDKLTLLASRVRTKGVVRVEQSAETDKPPSDEILSSVLVQLIRKNLLRPPEPVQPRKGATGSDKDKLEARDEWAISYSLRKDVQTERLETKFDLSVATRVERVTTFETSVLLAGQ